MKNLLISVFMIFLCSTLGVVKPELGLIGQDDLTDNLTLKSPPNPTVSTFEIENMGYGLSSMIPNYNRTNLHASYLNDDVISILYDFNENLTITNLNRTTGVLSHTDLGISSSSTSQNDWIWSEAHHSGQVGGVREFSNYVELYFVNLTDNSVTTNRIDRVMNGCYSSSGSSYSTVSSVRLYPIGSQEYIILGDYTCKIRFPDNQELQNPSRKFEYNQGCSSTNQHTNNFLASINSDGTTNWRFRIGGNSGSGDLHLQSIDWVEQKLILRAKNVQGSIHGYCGGSSNDLPKINSTGVSNGANTFVVGFSGYVHSTSNFAPINSANSYYGHTSKYHFEEQYQDGTLKIIDLYASIQQNQKVYINTNFSALTNAVHSTACDWHYSSQCNHLKIITDSRSTYSWGIFPLRYGFDSCGVSERFNSALVVIKFDSNLDCLDTFVVETTSFEPNNNYVYSGNVDVDRSSRIHSTAIGNQSILITFEATSYVHKNWQGSSLGVSNNIFIQTLEQDNDFDSISDNYDSFSQNPTQWADFDNDGFGDNWNDTLLSPQRANTVGEYFPGATNSDDCFSVPGSSFIDVNGCPDHDLDGYSNSGDDFDNDPTQYLDSDSDGYGDNLSGFQGDACPTIFGESSRNSTYGCVDADFDGWADFQDVFPYDSSQWSDWDGDGFGDELIGYEGDACPSQYGNSTNDRYGCVDDDGDGWSNAGDDFINNPTQYSDLDGDGYGDNQSVGATMSDAFPNDGTQWNDTDGDGYGDNPFGNQGDKFPNDATKWQDSDDDGYADEDDAFVNDATQWSDTDGDGYGDEANGNRPDAFPNDPLEWQDSDGDGYGNNADAFPVDGTQWNDTDGDGYGDNLYGTNGDVFPDDSTEWKDSDEDGVGNNADQYPYDPTQTIDSDGDGYGDNTNGTRGDVFPQDGTEWSDVDNDGYGDNTDLFLTDGTQWNDTDGDGFGDNLNGANGDACPLIAGNSSIVLLGCVDTDGDGYADQIDAFISDALSWSDLDDDSIPDELDAYPNDATQSLDSDGDGFGDNPLGTNADKFPNDATQWNDIDGDGYGDNLDGNNPDLFITDGTQWADSDGDGYGDNPQGRLYDMFPDNPTQWLDEDGDGLGDNQSGTNADPSLDDFDNDGFNDSIDILPKLPSPGDLDADGCLDEVDAFPENPQECVDTDNDGVGDNADSDDDDDGWTDADEIRLGTDSLSASEQPVDSFEIVVPGTSIGLSAWDLIGIFGGIPLFAWIAFGFATRNGRCDKYEELLRQATSRDELEQVALRWEYSLMLRMLGPHQGIRLERLRSELDDKFEFGENTEPEDIGVNQTSIVEQEAKELPPIEVTSETQSTPSKDTLATSTDDDGYEWLKTNDGTDWYRAANSGDQWVKFQS